MDPLWQQRFRYHWKTAGSSHVPDQSISPLRDRRCPADAADRTQVFKALWWRRTGLRFPYRDDGNPAFSRHALGVKLLQPRWKRKDPIVRERRLSVSVRRLYGFRLEDGSLGVWQAGRKVVLDVVSFPRALHRRLLSGKVVLSASVRPGNLDGSFPLRIAFPPRLTGLIQFWLTWV